MAPGGLKLVAANKHLAVKECLITGFEKDIERILHKFGLAFTLEDKSWPNQDSWYLLDHCGEKESFENEDI